MWNAAAGASAEELAAQRKVAERLAAERAATTKRPADQAAAEKSASERRETVQSGFLEGKLTSFSQQRHTQTIRSVDFSLTYTSAAVTLANVSFTLDPDSTEFRDHVDLIRKGKTFALVFRIQKKTPNQGSEPGSICCWTDKGYEKTKSGALFTSSDKTATVTVPFEITAQDIQSDNIRVWIYLVPDGANTGSGGSASLRDTMKY
jgi:hypothetical protein